MSLYFRPILFLDSGLGGLTIVREARIVLHGYCFIYLIDNAGFPYGEWEENSLRTRLLMLFSRVIDKYNPFLCVIACNTASTLALEDLRTAFPFCSFIGTVPAIKPAARYTKSGLISVLATPATLRCTYMQRLIISYAKQCCIRRVKSTKLAKIAEEYLHDRNVNLSAIEEEIFPCFVECGKKHTDIVILACTHYPFLIDFFRRVAPWPVDWLDPAQAIAQHARSFLAVNERMEQIPMKEQRDLALFTAGYPKNSVQNLMRSFGFECDTFAFPKSLS